MSTDEKIDKLLEVQTLTHDAVVHLQADLRNHLICTCPAHEATMREQWASINGLTKLVYCGVGGVAVTQFFSMLWLALKGKP